MITRKMTVIMMVVAICAIGCKEEEGAQPMLENDVAQKTTTPTDKTNHERYFFDDGGDRFGCTRMKMGNCLADVIVAAPDGQDFADFIINIQGGNQGVIQRVCLNSYDFLNEFISANFLDEVIAGNLTVSHKVNTVNGIQTDYILFHNLNLELELVIPFTI